MSLVALGGFYYLPAVSEDGSYGEGSKPIIIIVVTGKAVKSNITDYPCLGIITRARNLPVNQLPVSRRAQTSLGSARESIRRITRAADFSIWVRICQISFSCMVDFNSRKVLISTIVGCVIDSDPPPGLVLVDHGISLASGTGMRGSRKTFGFPIQPNLSLPYLLD